MTLHQELQQACVDARSRGWWVVPTVGKHPPKVHGWQNLRLEPEAFRDLLKPDVTGLGVILGPSGIVDLEADSPAAEAVFRQLAPATECSWEHGDRLHRIYHCVTEARKLALPPVLVKQLQLDEDRTCFAEVRTGNAHSVLPPSIHPDSRKRYRWVQQGSPCAVDAAVLQRVASLGAIAGAISLSWANFSRHHTALAVAGFLRSLDLTYEEAQVIQTAICHATNDEEPADRLRALQDTYEVADPNKKTTGFTRLKELIGEGLADWIAAQGREFVNPRSKPPTPTDAPPVDHFEETGPAGTVEVPDAPTEWPELRPLELHDLPPFPRGVFPAWAEEYIDAVAANAKVARCLPASTFLGIGALGCARKFIVRKSDGWEVPTNLYQLVIADVGEGKSPIQTAMLRPVMRWETSLRLEKQPEFERQTSLFDAEMKRKAKLIADYAKCDKDDERQMLREQIEQLSDDLLTLTPRPVPALLVDDITPEKLARSLADQNGRLAVFSTESALLDNACGLYNGGTPNINLLLQAHPGDAVKVHRVGKEEMTIFHPALTIHLAVQPAVIQKFREKSELVGKGLLQRFLISVPASSVGFRASSAQAIPQNVYESYEIGVNRLLWFDDPNGWQRDYSPHILALTPEAQAQYAAFWDWREPQLRPTGDLYDYKGFASKLDVSLLRIAGILHVLWNLQYEEPWREPIQRETMDRALELLYYFIDHTKAAYGLMEPTAYVKEAGEVLGWIKRTKRNDFDRQTAWNQFKKRKVYHKNSLGFVSTLELLAEHGYLVPLAKEKKGGGQKGSPHYFVNPGVFTESGAVYDR